MTSKNQSVSLLTNLTPTANAILNVEAEFSLYSNTGRAFSANNTSYFRFGNIYILENDQDRKSAYQIAETLAPASATTFTHTGANYRSGSITTNASYYVTMEINTVTNTLTSLKVYLTKSSTTPTLELSDVSLPTADYTVGIGYLKSGSMSTNQVELLKSIKVTQTTQEVQTAPYVVNYVYNGTTLDTKKGETAVNNVVEATSPITIEGKKYYAVDGATTSLTVTNVEANNVLNVELRAAHEYNYTVKNNFEENIATGVSIEDEAVYAAYPKYKNVDGTLHEAPTANNDSYYKCSFVPTSDNYVHTITYSAREIKNVVYYSEGENITGAEATSAGRNMGARSSNAACGYTTSDVTITNLLPGNYQVITCVYSNSSTGTTLNFAYGTETFTVTNAGASNGETHTNNITITEATDLVWQTSGGTQNGLDYIYIVKLPVTISLPADYIYSTFSSELPLDFSDNADVEAYIAYSADGKNVTLDKVTKVPAETGLVLKKLGAATTATVPVLEDINSITPDEQDVLDCNFLWPVLEPCSAEELLIGGGNAYILESDTKFSKVVKGATGVLAAGKAFLLYNAIGGGPLEMNILDGEATAIKGVEVKATRTDNAVYNLQGVRVNKPTANGLYIINGKKYLHK